MRVEKTNATQTARGAILTFLLLQLTHSATKGEIGTSNPFSEYVKFLPARIPLPTFWSEEEQLLVTGASLEAALKSKLDNLSREFAFLRDRTIALKWCQQHWWSEETGVLTFEDWKKVDAMYRSRALDLPAGHAMVPCMDMANHASNDETMAVYETDSNGDAILVLRDGKHLFQNDEVTISYGDDKGACEMLFSYGFIDSTMGSARELFLDLEIPNDDPLKLAKKAISKSPPGVRLFLDGESIGWESSYVWLIIVNEEDGLEFQVLQNADGGKELQALWKGKVGPDMSKLEALIEHEALRDVFHLRVVITLQNRIEQQLLRLESSKKWIDEQMKSETIGDDVRKSALELRELEESLMLHAYESFESKVKIDFQ